uniref:Uncharacterized protein n=1 Tax=Globodera rostochiensis TaxID=31243 RepID=A0A914HKD4_GLORO
MHKFWNCSTKSIGFSRIWNCPTERMKQHKCHRQKCFLLFIFCISAARGNGDSQGSASIGHAIGAGPAGRSFGNGTGLGSASRAGRAGPSSAAAGRENGTLAIVLMLFIALGITLFCFCIRGGHFFESEEEQSTRDACAGCNRCCDLCAILPLLLETPGACRV